MPITRMISIATFLFAIALHPTAAAIGADMQMHRAVYELSLGRSQPVSDIAGIEGRMVVEWRGGAECGGYTSMQRVVTHVTGGDEASVSNDVRLSTWEAADGGDFRFTRTEYVNGQLIETESGFVRRDAAKEKTTIEREGEAPIEMSGDVLFPIAHSLALMAAARAGKQIFSAPLFDGTEKTENPTNAFIGKALAAPRETVEAAVVSGEGARLGDMKAWPVRLSYFDGDNLEGLPDFEMGYLLFPNGVSAALVLDYLDVEMIGRLTELHYFKPGSC
ncbi:MAG: cell envelope integrity EipB family protein [Parvibaculum sp.]|uniref:cell envelope integrity EipB family protein n=1 Tax=Parvibaculum sp. TaxID=2024848 RepID=UPI0032EDC0CD